MVKLTRSRYFLLGMLIAIVTGAGAATVSYFGSGSADQLGVSLATLISGEDQTNNVLRVEGQFSYQTPVAVDTPIKGTPGYIKSLTCSPTDNAAVAGTIQLRDATSAGTGNVVFEWTVLAIDYTVAGPRTWPIEAVMGTGIYLDFTTTSDVKCWATYR